MKYPVFAYKLVAIAAFLVLGGVQFFLLFNMYRMEDEHFYNIEKQKMHDVYERVIRNDKLYPNAVNIIDRYVYNYMDTLGVLYKQGKMAAFDRLRQQMCDSLFAELRRKNCGDSLMRVIRSRLHLTDSLEYSMMMGDIDFAYEPGEYTPIYDHTRKYPHIDASIQEKEGIRIAGTLTNMSTRNSISAITVSSPEAHSYKMSFMFNVDTPGRLWAVIKRTIPVFLLSLFSIFLVLAIFYVTFRNWLKQKKVSDMQSDFINNITHEFHTPISAIMVANKSLQNEKIAEKKENIHSLTGVIGRQAVRLKTLIGQVIDVSVGRMVQLNKTACHLNDLLDEVLLDYQLNISDSSVQLTFEKHTTCDIVLVDKFYFTTMLQNIIDNGIKYNSSQPKTIIVSTSNDEETVSLSVRDNGIGMSEETTRRMFEKFYRAANWKKDTLQGQGLGLGLHYAKQCLDAHNWTVQIRSKADEGSEFIIFIPLYK